MLPQKLSLSHDILAEAANPMTPAARLERLALDYPIDYTVAAYPDMPFDLIREHDSDQHIALAQAIVGNPNTPLPTLLKLAQHFPAQFFANPIFPLLALENAGWLFALRAATAGALLRSETPPASFVSQLLRHPDPVVRQTAQLHIHLADETGSDWEEKVRDALRQHTFPTIDSAPYRQFPFGIFAQSHMLPLWLLEALADHEQSQVKTLAMVNPDLPAEMQALAAAPARDRRHSYLYARAMWFMEYRLKFDPHPEHGAAQNHHTLPQTLAQFARYPNWLTRRYVALNPATPLDVLAILANDTVPEVAEAVALHSKATPDLAWYIYGRLMTSDIPTRNTFYRMVALASPFMSPRRLAAHVGASDWVERLAIARNPRTPDATLALLVSDGNTLVRAAARAMLRARLVLTLEQGGKR